MMRKPLGEEMDFFRQYNEVLFNQLEKKMLDKEIANQQLRISVEEYQLQFENISDVVFMIGTDFNILSISPSVEKLLGYKAEDFIGRPASDLKHIFTPESFERGITNIGKMLKNEIIPVSTYTFVAKNGTLKHIEIHGSPLIRDGQVAGTISVARDITERKLIEEKLRFEEKRFRAFVEHSSDILVLMNLEGTIAYTNPAVEQVLGFKPEERIGAKGFELVHPDELKFLADSFNILARDANAPVIKSEMRLRHKDGSWRTLEAVGSNLVNNNVVEAIIVNYRDITDRKRTEEELRESEERYRELVKYAPAGIYEVDYETNLFIGVNEVICEYSGYSRDELLTTNFFNLFTEESQKLMLARLEKLMANENIPQTAEYCIRTKGGEELWVHLSARYIYESGKLKGATGVVYNITERKKAESQREAALDALRKSEDKYRTLIETTNTGYVIIDQDGLVLDANSEYVRLTGHHDLSEIVGRSVMAWTAESAKEKNAESVKACFDKGYIRNLEIDYVDAKGNVTPIEINATCMEIERKKFTITICRDITERKQAEEALRENEKKYRELSIIDDLTQLYNSRHFYAQLETEIERSNRYGQPLTLLLLDLDKFKKFNDKYGHVEGDHVLSQLGQVIKRCLRDPDSAYRYGGEEFTIMLPMTTINEGIVTAKRIQSELRKEAFSPVEDKKIYMTVSIGLAQYKPKEEMKTFVQRVDQLMYQAKKEGRDRICPDRSRNKQSIIGST